MIQDVCGILCHNVLRVLCSTTELPWLVLNGRECSTGCETCKRSQLASNSRASRRLPQFQSHVPALAANGQKTEDRSASPESSPIGARCVRCHSRMATDAQIGR